MSDPSFVYEIDSYCPSLHDTPGFPLLPSATQRVLNGHTSASISGIHLSLEEGQLYLRQVIVQEEEHLHCIGSAEKFPYTGAIFCSGVCYSFLEGKWVDSPPSPYARKASEQKTFSSLFADDTASAPRKERQPFISEFCRLAQRFEKEKEQQSQFLRQTNPEEGAQFRRYAHRNVLFISDAYHDAERILGRIAFRLYRPLAARFDVLSACGYYCREVFFRRLKAHFQREELAAVLDFCSRADLSADGDIPLSDALYRNFCTLETLIPLFLPPEPKPQQYTRRPFLLRNYLD